MSDLYYKCNNCNFEMILHGQNIKYPAVPVCKNCKSKMHYSKRIEKAWLNEKDNNGKKKRIKIWSTNQSECIKKACLYFKCNANEIDFFHITPQWLKFINGFLEENFCRIFAWKPSYNIDSKAIKIVTDASDVNGWIAVNPTDKIIYEPVGLCVINIKYKEIISLKSESSTGYELKLKTYDESDQYYTFRIYFLGNNNVDVLVDVLYNDLPISENEMYITCFFKKSDIPPNSYLSSTSSLNDELKIQGCFIWKDDKYLNICDDDWRNGIKIKLDQIKYYRIIGDKYVTTDVSGGGGGGTSLAGAIVGGVIAGGAGAVVGSRKSVESIQSKSTVHDNRTVYIYSKDQTRILKFSFGIYQQLLELLPEKEYEIVINTAQQVPAQPVVSNNSVDTADTRSKLKELKSMFEEDLITEEEYNRKRQELLRKI